MCIWDGTYITGPGVNCPADRCPPVYFPEAGGNFILTEAYIVLAKQRRLCGVQGYFFLLLSVLFYSFCCGSEKAMFGLRQDQILRYTLSAAPSYSVGQPVEIIFTLDNVSTDTLFILSWYTPLEGLKGNIFSVMLDSTEIHYRGPMVKRGQPDQNDYIRLAPGGRAEKKIDLSRGYDLSIPGSYTVAFNRQIKDVVKAPAKVPRLVNDHSPVRANGNIVTLNILEP